WRAISFPSGLKKFSAGDFISERRKKFFAGDFISERAKKFSCRRILRPSWMPAAPLTPQDSGVRRTDDCG
ncbi:MAG: hypothetical protein II902_12505, partial [Selenomonadaceae bacterium]|nr:hypothetical protein [Selenomonadaceae bacterium]